MRALVTTFSYASHLNAFALIIVLMIAGFAVFPYMSAYFVSNLGMTEAELPLIFIVGGALTLLTSPAIGRLADRFGKRQVYRFITPFSALLFFGITHLPRVGLGWIVAAYAGLMVCNIGRMIAAMALVTGSVEAHQRGGFLSANSSVQHIASGLAAFLGGMIVTQAPDGRLEHFGAVGWIAAGATLASLWFIGRVHSLDAPSPSAEELSLPAAAEAVADAGEPILGVVHKS